MPGIRRAFEPFYLGRALGQLMLPARHWQRLPTRLATYVFFTVKNIYERFHVSENAADVRAPFTAARRLILLTPLDL
jgi:hypothetical protein